MVKIARFFYVIIWLFYLSLLVYLIPVKGSYDRMIEFKELVVAGIHLERSAAIKEPFTSLRLNWSRWYLISTKIEVLGNIIGFFPFGLLLYGFFTKMRYFILVIMITMVFSLGLESVQYVYGIGQFDVDDILMNTFGASVGYVMIWCTANCRRHSHH